MSMKCPKCGQALETAGRAAGASITCGTCGNVTAVQGNSRKWLYVILGVGSVVLALPCIIGVVAAVTIPNFTSFNGRARQGECKANLKAWYTAERTTEGGLSTRVKTVGFEPERGNRYAYFAGRGPMEDRSGNEPQGGEGVVGYGVDTHHHPEQRPITLEQLPESVVDELGLHGSQCPQGPDCTMTAACAGNLDGDDTLDVWTVSTTDRIGPDGRRYAAGEPMHVVDDIQQ
jgi:type IV pilus assembly protein PilA